MLGTGARVDVRTLEALLDGARAGSHTTPSTNRRSLSARLPAAAGPSAGGGGADAATPRAPRSVFDQLVESRDGEDERSMAALRAQITATVVGRHADALQRRNRRAVLPAAANARRAEAACHAELARMLEPSSLRGARRAAHGGGGGRVGPRSKRESARFGDTGGTDETPSESRARRLERFAAAEARVEAVKARSRPTLDELLEAPDAITSDDGDTTSDDDDDESDDGEVLMEVMADHRRRETHHAAVDHQHAVEEARVRQIEEKLASRQRLRLAELALKRARALPPAAELSAEDEAALNRPLSLWMDAMVDAARPAPRAPALAPKPGQSPRALRARALSRDKWDKLRTSTLAEGEGEGEGVSRESSKEGDGDSSRGDADETAAAEPVRPKGERYLPGHATGDINAAYPTTVDPSKLELSRRMSKLRRASLPSLGGQATERPLFSTQWLRLRGPENRLIFAIGGPTVTTRLPEAADLAPLLRTELPPELLLATGTDIDDCADERVPRLLLALVSRLLARTDAAAAAAAASAGAADAADAPPAGAGGYRPERKLPPAGPTGLALIEAHVCNRDADADALLGFPMRTALSALEHAAAGGAGGKKKKGGSKGAGAASSTATTATPADDESGLASLERIGAELGRAAKSARSTSKARAAAQANAAADAAAAAPAAAPAGADASAPAALDAATRKRVQKCLDELHAPLEQQVDFQCKYTPPAAADALAAALPLWEEAAEAMKAYRYAERRKEDDADRFAAAQERCAAAAEAMLRVAGDVAAFEGVAFVDIVGVRGGGGDEGGGGEGGGGEGGGSVERPALS